MGIVEKRSGRSGEMKLTLRALILPVRASSLALRIDPVHFGASTGEARNAVRPALGDEVVEGLFFGSELSGYR